MMLDEQYQNSANGSAFRSCIQGTGLLGVPTGMSGNQRGALGIYNGRTDYLTHWDALPGLVSAQFQVGAELSEAVTTEA